MKRIIHGTPHALLLLLCLLAMLPSPRVVAVGQVRKTDVRKLDKPSAKRGPVDSDDLKDQQPTKKAAKVFHGETSDQKDAKLAGNTISLASDKVQDSSKKTHIKRTEINTSSSGSRSSTTASAPQQGFAEAKPPRKDSEIKEPEGGAEEPHHPPHSRRPHATGCSSIDSQDLDKCKEAKSVFRKPERKK